MKIKLTERVQIDVFYLAYVRYAIPRYFQYTSLEQIAAVALVFKIAKLVSYLCLALLCFNRIKEMKCVGLAKVLCTAGVMGIVIGQVIFWDANAIFVVLLMSFAFVNQDLTYFLRLTLKLQAVMFGTTVLLAVFGVIPNVVVPVVKFGIHMNRMSLGFNYPGQLLMSCMPMVFLSYYLCKKITWKMNLFWVIFTTLCFVASQTLMPYAIILLFIFCSNLLAYTKFDLFRTNIHCGLLKQTANIAFVSTLVLTFLQYKQNKIALILNEIVNYRFSLNVTAIQKYGISLFGTGFQNIQEGGVGGEYLFLDSEYMFMLVSNGIIYTLVALVLMKCVLDFCVEKENTRLTLILVLMLLYLIVNNGMFNLITNPFIIILVSSIQYKIENSGIRVIGWNH